MNKLRIYVDLTAPASAIQLLREGSGGHELLFPPAPARSVLAQSEAGPQMALADVVFGQPDPQAIAAAPRLKWIHISSSGITRYDNPAFRALLAERRIVLTNSASVYNEPCAVQALSFILAQVRNLPAALASRAAGGSEAWDVLRNSSSTLRGETILIAGFGAIGRRLAELLQPFCATVSAYRRTPRGDEPIPVIATRELSAHLGKADHVVDILPDNPATRHFFDAGRFAAMKPGACFYNIGRGATVDQDTLLAHLRSGHLRAAWLDVTEPEPLPDEHPLRAQPNCYITPHIAGGHPEEAKSLVRHFLRNLELFVAGKPLADQVIGTD